VKRGRFEGVRETGEEYFEMDALEQISSRCPTLYSLSLFLKIPGMIYPARRLFNALSRP